MAATPNDGIQLYASTLPVEVNEHQMQSESVTTGGIVMPAAMHSVRVLWQATPYVGPIDGASVARDMSTMGIGKPLNLRPARQRSWWIRLAGWVMSPWGGIR